MQEKLFLAKAHTFFKDCSYGKALECYWKFIELCPEIGHLVKANEIICRKKIKKSLQNNYIVLNVPVFNNKKYATQCYTRIISSAKCTLSFKVINGYAEQNFLRASIAVKELVEQIQENNLDRENILRIFFKKISIFDDKFYQSQYKLKDNVEPLEHYLTEGFASGFLPSRWFDVYFEEDEHMLALQNERENEEVVCNQDPKISIIIPVYNNANYLRECLESVVNQSLTDIEIIIVNDGSTDSDSVSILESYAENDSRIHLIHKKNTGYGHSMNCGLYASKGEYIGIVESDDFINDKMYEMLYQKAKKNDLDYVKGDSVQFSYENGIRKDNYVPSRKNKNEYNVIIDPTSNQTAFQFSITCCGIYKNEFLKKYDIYYNETPGSSYQDISFAFLATCHAKSVCYINYPCYYYRQDNDMSSIHRRDNIYMAYAQYMYVHDKLMLYSKKYSIFSSMLFYRMFHSFVYTYNRIGFKSKKEFIIFFSNKFLELIVQNRIDFSLFSKDERLMLEQITSTPITYYLNTAKVDVVFAVNDNYVKYLWCAISSLIDVSSSTEKYNITILCFELSKRNEEILMNLTSDNVSINILFCDKYLDDVELYEAEHYSKEMYLRMLIPVLFKDKERVIYFDCDIIFTKDISNLFYVDISSPLGAVKNYCNNSTKKYVQQYLEIDYTNYFNSGFLVFNINEFNKKNIYKKLVDIIKGNKKFKMPDQDMFNIACQNEVVFLDPRWNFQWHNLIAGKVDEFSNEDKYEYIKASSDPFVIHYTSGVKPWIEKHHHLSKYYLNYERKFDKINNAGNNKYKVSVIIPVYNEEKFLPRALESVLSQTISCEIICIDDGSTDRSYDILKKFAESSGSVKLMQQRNLGAGIARNQGLKAAQGEFIYFLDADDYCPNNSVLEVLYNKAKAHGVKICGGSLCYDRNGKKEFLSNSELVFDQEGLRSYSETQYDYGYQRYIYNAAFLADNELLFPDYLRFQDPVFFVKTMFLAKYFYAITEPTYCYKNESAKINWTKKKVHDLICALKDNIKFAKENNLKKLYSRTLWRITGEYKNIIERFSEDGEIVNELKKIDEITSKI